MKAGKVLLSVFAGVAAGATLGILYAPKKGSKTRQMIMDKGESYAEGLQKSSKTLMDKGESYLEGLQGKYDEFLAALTAKYESLQHKSDVLATNGKARYEEVKKEVKNSVL